MSISLSWECHPHPSPCHLEKQWVSEGNPSPQALSPYTGSFDNGAKMRYPTSNLKWVGNMSLVQGLASHYPPWMELGSGDSAKLLTPPLLAPPARDSPSQDLH